MSQSLKSLAGAGSAGASSTSVYNRVPAATADFWLIKLMAVTMGETAADCLAVNLGFGLTATSRIMTAVLIGALVLQFGQKRYVPWSYWLAVVLISIVGTLVTDNLVGSFGVSLVTTTVIFTLALAATFALGTAAGDLVAEHFGLGYMATGILFGMIIASLALGYFFLGLDPILGFWLAYIFARPLGASFGDLLSQPTQYGGMGLGTIVTSALFLAAIIAIVAYMSFTREGQERAVAQ